MLIAVTGPESSGKTTLAKQLAEALGAEYVPEFARSYLEGKGSYSEEDLLEIAKGQIELEKNALCQKPRYLVIDTEMLVMKVWSEWRFGRVHPHIEEQFRERQYDLLVLCSPDLPWEEDPLREHPDEGDRQIIFEHYKKHLEDYEKPYMSISGKDRLGQVLDAINLPKKV